LGFTSAWFALAAPLNPPLLAARAASVINGFAFWLALLSFTVCLNRGLNRESLQLSDWFLAAYWFVLLPIVALHSLFKVMLVSSAPEISVMFLTGITAWSLMLSLLNTNRLSSTAQAIPLILAAGTMTMKLVAIPLLLVIGLCYLTGGKLTMNRLAIGGGILGLIVVPFLASSLITSGCPLYPSTLFCLDVPWAPTHINLEEVAKATHDVTSWFKGAPSGSNPWLWAIEQFFVKDHMSVAISLSGIGTIVLISYAIKRFRLQQLRIYCWIVGITISGMAFLLLTAPFSRFTLPYIVLTLALALAILGMQIYSHPFARSVLTTINQQLTQITRFEVPLLPMMAVIVIGIGISAADRLVLPPPMKNDPIVQKQVNNIHYWSPMVKNDTTVKLCWSAPIPCAFEITPDVWLRDPNQGISGGFVRQR
jgi:hypothetical protein